MTSEAAFDVPAEGARSEVGTAVEPAGSELGAGWFRVDALDRSWWSDGMYALHGLAPGEVVPTAALLLAHQHPQERSRVAALLERVAVDGVALACASRLVDFDGRTHDVVLSAEPDGEAADDGRRPLRGTLVLLDGVVGELARRRADVQLEQALESRSVIDQAKGVLAAAGGYDEGEAFDALRAVSQRRNVRVRVVADEVVRGAREVGARAPSPWLAEVLGEGPRPASSAESS
ncbi:ANTAR domain-containing protein [Luteimicrobium sp. NPDC057192]|uniref:ANTAR domain-containing protein n=1 Tax=Luteimicrobium sp. NPDC057192 TaxID=3346042 RepID=UPI00362A2606